MEPAAKSQKHKGYASSLYLKCGAILTLLLTSILLVACGGSASALQSPLSTPQVTVTIHLATNDTGKLPTLPPYTCGAWTTNASPAYNGNVPIPIYAKFVQSVAGNPQGVAGASATATYYWGDGTVDTQTASTGTDGLAFFSMSAATKGGAVGKLSLVTVSFAKAGTPGCTVDKDRAAFFTLTTSNNPGNGGTATPVATGTPGTGGIPLTPPAFPFPGGPGHKHGN
jgi:hypothetical protein